MSTEKVQHEYGADEIQILEGLEAVRKRPGMYIGSTSARGLHHLVYEIVDNSVDEALAGFCDSIYVEINKESRLHDILGDGLYVNSRHREGIKKLAPSLREAARARDGIIEAVESRDNELVAAVQWHPENMEDGVMDPLFRAFADRIIRLK